MDRNVARVERQDGPSVEVAPALLTVRCYARKQDHQWLAFSVEFGLAAQSDTLFGAQRRLESMV